MRVRVAVAAGLMLTASGWFAAVRAEDYCCICRGQSAGKALTADDEMAATIQCSLLCRRPTGPRDGACVAPSPAPIATPTPAAAPGPGAGQVLLYRTDDCSGEGLTVTQSSRQLPGGMRSFSLAFGPPVTAFEQPGFAGARTAPVGPSLCVSPGWSIAAIRIGAD